MSDEARPIYLDNHATTRVDPRVVEAMLPWLTERYGNAASRSHVFGWEAEDAVEEARASIARLVGARSAKTIVFTSGATESNNLALKGVAHAMRERGDHIITQKTEHKSVIDSCRRLEREGFRVTWLDVDGEGRVDPDAVGRAIDDRTVLVSIMLCNNEVGTIQPIADIGAITHERGVLLHCDAVQGVGRTDFDVEAMHVDLASLSAHKIYGPKGVGALYVRRSKPRVRLVAEIDGGGHERGMRSGTLNVPGIMAFARAADLLADGWREEAERVRTLRERLRHALFSRIEELHLNGAEDPWRHPGNLNISFGYVEGEALIMALQKELAVSSGSACTSATIEPSYVLRAMGVDDDLAHASIRFGLGRFTTEDEVDRAADIVVRQVDRLRKLSPLWKMREEGVDPATLRW